MTELLNDLHAVIIGKISSVRIMLLMYCLEIVLCVVDNET